MKTKRCFADWVGRYRLVVTGELLEFIEREFVAVALPAERNQARQTALTEAAVAEIEILPDGTFVSRAGGHEFYRSWLGPGALVQEHCEFEKAPGQRVRLEWLEPGVVVAHQPGRPATLFRRST